VTDNLAGDQLEDHHGPEPINFIESRGAGPRPRSWRSSGFSPPHAPIAAGDADRLPYHDRTMEEQHCFGLHHGDETNRLAGCATDCVNSTRGQHHRAGSAATTARRDFEI